MTVPSLFGLFALVGLSFAVFFLFRNLVAGRIWSGFADDHGLDHIDGGMQGHQVMSGDWKGMEVSLRTLERRTAQKANRNRGQKSTTYTTYKTSLGEDFPATLELCNKSIFQDAQHLQKMLPGRDLQMEQTDLHGTFVIRAQSAEDAHLFLDDEEVAEALYALHDVQSTVKLEEQTLQIEHSGPAFRAGRIEERLDALVETAQVLRRRAEEVASGEAVASW